MAYKHKSPIGVIEGGTQNTSFITDAVVYYDGTKLNSTVGPSGSVLSSNGSGTVPIWQTVISPGYSVASVTLTSAQVKALNSTPVTLIAAPGAGMVIAPFMAVTKMTYGGNNPFTGGISIGVNWTGVSGGFYIAPASQITASNSTLTFNISNSANSVGVSYTNVSNKAFIIPTIGSPFAGNAAGDNTLTIVIYYLTITI